MVANCITDGIYYLYATKLYFYTRYLFKIEMAYLPLMISMYEGDVVFKWLISILWVNVTLAIFISIYKRSVLNCFNSIIDSIANMLNYFYLKVYCLLFHENISIC